MSNIDYLDSVHSKFADKGSGSYLDCGLWRKRYQKSAGRSIRVLNKIQVREVYADLFNREGFKEGYDVPEQVKTTQEFIDWMNCDEN